ncbi:High affinity Ca2+/Mn2+ P-type ATPase-like protein [Puccinia graminis f. sp. tritici]|uniref:P-type Ca(2+) transporter n=1 Tax=Puccinia graminis f. sp. tritici TaxID=56615 RepID=A0A5B0Q9N4_PUCGR|nr:High affinity Ca2+/Mn2+ P-type ATPase-like protein [Puccinia graminis f. sp. tritici]
MYNNSSSNHQDKPLYIGLTPIKSSSPPPQPIGTPPTTDEGFAYSTLLRRAEDETLLRTSHHHHHHRLPSPTTSTFPHHKAHPTTQDDPQNPSSSSFYASATPSAHYSVQSIDQVVQQFNTHPVKGLPSQSVPAIRGIHGPNEFQVDARESVLKKFLAQFYESPLNLLLLGSAAVSYIVGNTDDAISITAAIVIVVTVGFIQEQRSEKSLAALNKLVPHYCHLTRDGQPQTLLANVLVPGDLVTFSVGDRIPADLRLIKATQLEIDESSMTGETKPMKKQVDRIQVEGRLPDISERTNVALMGTLVKNGNGAGIVVGTGSQTEFGVVFGMMQEVEERKTPLQLSMDELAKKLSAISFAVIAVICLIGLWQKRSWLEMFTVGVSLAVAAIPEGLPIVVTVTLALGVLRMSKRKAIVKKLHSVETLGSVSVICSDKTGTLTTNQMTVTQIFTIDDGLKTVQSLTEPNMHMLKISDVILKTLEIANLCVNAYRNQDGTNVGTSTEVALLNVLTILGVEDCRPLFNRKSETPFTSEAKYSSVVGSFKTTDSRPSNAPLSPRSSRSTQSMITDPDTHYLIGAPEVVLSRCKFYLKSDSVTTSLDEDGARAKITQQAEKMAKSGLRVLAMAYGFDSNNMIFTGLQGMTDPPRKGVSTAIASLQKGGVHVVMITGDSEFTATAISRELGILTNSGISSCLTGQEIDRLTPRQLIDRVKGTSVFARVTPRHKMSIIEAFQSTGSVVAMTGDGVNDAPALRMADIGISMGKGATDVAKEAADLILVDDNFSTILPAIEEGKTIFYNIQNFLAFQLSTAVAALSLITISTILGLPAPLNAMQILFINILMDGPPSQSLGVDPVNKEVMKRKPRSKHSAVLTIRLLYRIGFSAIMIIGGTLFIYLFDLKGPEVGQRDQTVTFTSFVFLDLISAIQNRGLNVDLFPRSLTHQIQGFIQYKIPAFFSRASRKIYHPISRTTSSHHHLVNRDERLVKTHNPILLITVLVSFLSLLMIIYLPVLQKIFQTQALDQRDLVLLLALGSVSFACHEIRRYFERLIEKNENDSLLNLNF